MGAAGRAMGAKTAAAMTPAASAVTSAAPTSTVTTASAPAAASTTPAAASSGQCRSCDEEGAYEGELRDCVLGVHGCHLRVLHSKHKSYAPKSTP